MTLTLVAAALAGSVYGGSELLRGDTLRVREVTVVGTQISDPHAVVAAAALGGESMLDLDTTTAIARITELPGVESADVQRAWPNGIVIDITEEQGWGYWQARGVRRLISADGRVLEHARAPTDDAPTIIESGPPPAAGEPALQPDRDTVQLVARLHSDGTFEHLRVTPTGFVFRHDRGLTILVEEGPHAVFGDSHNYEFKIAAWGSLLDRIDQQRLEANEVDLRFGGNLVLR
ncbi:MAG TPA: FtsQ-type POTRA domain-containing protein [Dehalococcoidia bacterium]|nr:FtsQ-type POTRA domain-containing protein [Dehalococcoidia bacterium]